MVTRRELALLGLTAIASIPATHAATTDTGESNQGVDPNELLSHVDPELRPFLRTLPPATPMTAEKLRRMRQTLAQGSDVAPPAAVVTRSIPGPRGGPEVRLLIVGSSPDERPRPALLYLHGGGYIGGSTASSWPRFSGLQQIAKDHDCVVVSVDYRLAPETPFPGALEDNYAALKWLQANAESLGADPRRIAIMGESAGGGHAATLTLAARDRGEVPIIFQLLIYPMLDDRTGSTKEVAPHIGAFIWTRQANRFGWTALLGVPAGSRVVPRGSVPARATNLSKLPPTYIGVGALDLFVNEDIEFARRLLNDGVPTELYVAPGAYHGFFFLAPDAAISKRFASSYNAALTKAFASAV